MAHNCPHNPIVVGKQIVRISSQQFALVARHPTPVANGYSLSQRSTLQLWLDDVNPIGPGTEVAWWAINESIDATSCTCDHCRVAEMALTFSLRHFVQLLLPFVNLDAGENALSFRGGKDNSLVKEWKGEDGVQVFLINFFNALCIGLKRIQNRSHTNLGLSIAPQLLLNFRTFGRWPDSIRSPSFLPSPFAFICHPCFIHHSCLFDRTAAHSSPSSSKS